MLGQGKIEEDPDVSLSRFDRSVFGLLIHRLPSEGSAALVAERILELIREPLVVEDKEIHLTASIGIAVYPRENVDAVGLLRLASGARDDVRRLKQ